VPKRACQALVPCKVRSAMHRHACHQRTDFQQQIASECRARAGKTAGSHWVQANRVCLPALPSCALPDSCVTSVTSVAFRCLPVSHMRCTTSTGTLGGCRRKAGRAKVVELQEGAKKVALPSSTTTTAMPEQAAAFLVSQSSKHTLFPFPHRTPSHPGPLPSTSGTASPLALGAHSPAFCGRTPGTLGGQRDPAPSCQASAAGSAPLRTCQAAC